MKITTRQEWYNFTKLVDTSKIKISSVKISNGWLCINEDILISGTWPENEKAEVIDYLSEKNQDCFKLLKEKSFIFGKDPTKRVVSCAVKDSKFYKFIEHEDGRIEQTEEPYQWWIISEQKLTKDWEPLRGNLKYKFIKKYNHYKDYQDDKQALYRYKPFIIWDEKEAALISKGVTYFKGMKVKDVSVLAFDIETNGLTKNSKSFIFCISSAYRNCKGNVEKKLFSSDEYPTQKAMIEDWCLWVRQKNPSILVAHNGYGFDLPYLDHVARMNSTRLMLGRDGSPAVFEEKTSLFRKDGSQSYEYNKCHIFGREIIDTMFLSYKYDVGRKYESYGLKTIIKQEKLEKPGRQFYEASKIGENWGIKEERDKIKAYVIDDSDDALALYDLMIPSFFYFNQSIPKTFQAMNYSASGSQLNAFLLRSYLQMGHSVPATTESVPFEGAISDGYPGVYKNVFKVDVASLYPSIILSYNIYDKIKDPLKHFIYMVRYFTEERLQNKKLAADTGDRYYSDLEQSQKIGINSAYGLLGATGLHFNSPVNASIVTRRGREILKEAIKWASSKDYVPSKSIETEDEEDA